MLLSQKSNTYENLWKNNEKNNKNVLVSCCSLIKGITPKIHMNSVILNLLCVWIKCLWFSEWLHLNHLTAESKAAKSNLGRLHTSFAALLENVLVFYATVVSEFSGWATFPLLMVNYLCWAQSVWMHENRKRQASLMYLYMMSKVIMQRWINLCDIINIMIYLFLTA